MMEVLYEDNHVIGVVKPYNIPVQEDSSGDEDLLSMVKAYIKDRYNKPGKAFAALVHRLDRPSGGVIIFARTSKAASRLGKAFNERKTAKEYLCVMHGKVTPSERKVVHYLRKDREKNIVTAHKKEVEGSKKAVLSYRVLEVKNYLSLVRVTLETGRSHQIRVQFKKIGHPLWGDHKYGRDAKGKQLALWSYSLAVPHPVKDSTINLCASPPDIAPWNLFKKSGAC